MHPPPAFCNQLAISHPPPVRDWDPGDGQLVSDHRPGAAQVSAGFPQRLMWGTLLPGRKAARLPRALLTPPSC